MQTVILAGGEGTRLRPLTSQTPKPLVRIAGKSPAERLLKQLREAGIRSATLCTHYRAEQLKEALGSRSNGVRLRYVKEEYPLGTAGCVRNAWNGDDVLVLSGDSVCGFDISAILAFHEKSSADVTIVTREVSDPREYGLLTVGDDGRITGFIEKPGYDECLTNLANTGAYVISKEVMKRIPEGEKTDFASDVFPALLAEGKRLFAYTDRTFWHDIGDIPSLLAAQRDILSRDGVENLTEGADIADGTTVSGGSVIEGGASVGGGRIISSLILSGATVASGADICEAVIGENVTAGEGLIMKRFSALGDGCVVGSDVTVGEGARIAPRTKIPDGAIIRSDISDAGYSSLSFGEDGEAKGLHGAEDHLRFGLAVGAALGEENIAIGGIGRGAEAISLGLRAAGVAVYDLGRASFGETVYCARRLECGHFIHVGEEISLLRSSDLTLPRREERKIEQAFNRSAQSAADRPAQKIDGSAASGLYLRHLRSLLPKENQIRASLRTDDFREAEIFSGLWRDGDGEKVSFSVASDRRTVSASTERSVLSYENLVILCCKSYFEKRRSVVLPRRAPLSCEEIAKQYRSSAIRSEGELSLFFCDPIELIFELSAYLSKRGISLDAAVSELPKVVYTRRIIEAPEGLPKIMGEGFGDARAGSDITLENGGARAYVRPLKSGKAVSLYIESVSAEAAGALSEDITRRIRGEAQNR